MDEVGGLIERDARRVGGHDYAAFHAQRFAYLLETARRLRPDAQRVLDVGCGPFTQMARDVFPEVWTLGFAGQAVENRIAYDLNAIQYRDNFPPNGSRASIPSASCWTRPASWRPPSGPGSPWR